jgi:precorrin-6Y C5,15-methyltransferase (decarboxylating)
VRAAILGHLQIRRTDTVWDVGAGTGSVSVEMAMKASEGKVFAVERGEEGCALIQKNKEKFGVWNLTVVPGTAPEALAELPAPDRVFVGGSSGNLAEIIRAALDKNPQARICVSAIVLETMQEAIEVLTDEGMAVNIVQVAVNTARKVGNKHMMMAGNPIYIITGQKQRCTDV